MADDRAGEPSLKGDINTLDLAVDVAFTERLIDKKRISVSDDKKSLSLIRRPLSNSFQSENYLRNKKLISEIAEYLGENNLALGFAMLNEDAYVTSMALRSEPYIKNYKFRISVESSAAGLAQYLQVEASGLLDTFTALLLKDFGPYNRPDMGTAVERLSGAISGLWDATMYALSGSISDNARSKLLLAELMMQNVKGLSPNDYACTPSISAQGWDLSQSIRSVN